MCTPGIPTLGLLSLMPAGLSVWQHAQKNSEKCGGRQAGREARHGGRSGPPRLRPAVLLSCSSPFCEQSRHREEGEHRGGGGLWSTSVTLLHIIWESGGKEGFARQGGTDWQTKGDLRFDVLSQKTVVLLSAPPEDAYIITANHILRTVGVRCNGKRKMWNSHFKQQWQLLFWIKRLLKTTVYHAVYNK